MDLAQETRSKETPTFMYGLQEMESKTIDSSDATVLTEIKDDDPEPLSTT